MERVLRFREIGGIPWRPHNYNREQALEIAQRSPMYRECLPSTMKAVLKLPRQFPDCHIAVIDAFNAAGMIYVYGQTGNIKMDVRAYMKDTIENDAFQYPWSYYGFEGVDFMGFSHSTDAVRFKLSVEDYAFVTCTPTLGRN